MSDEIIYFYNVKDDKYYQSRYTHEYLNNLIKENQSLKKQLEYLRSGEYYNQLKFENEMLQDVVDNGEVSKEDRKFIDCTHRNTELLEQQKKFIEYLENNIKNIDEAEKQLRKDRIPKFFEHGIVKGERYATKGILSKYKEIIGGK